MCSSAPNSAIGLRIARKQEAERAINVLPGSGGTRGHGQHMYTMRYPWTSSLPNILPFEWHCPNGGTSKHDDAAAVGSEAQLLVETTHI